MGHPVLSLHNHTPFSDGAYTIDELIEAHLDCETADFDGVGISDSLFRTPSSREIGDARDFERTFGRETRNYVDAVHAARRRWSGKVEVYCGCEINWPLNKGHLDAIRGMLNGIDYVMFEFIDWAGLTQLANQARRWPVPVGLSHTDVTRTFPNTSMDQVVRTMANARIFYEANVCMAPMSDHEAWFSILPNHRVRVAIGADTHDDLRCINHIGSLIDYVDSKGLEEKHFIPTQRVEAAVAEAVRT